MRYVGGKNKFLYFKTTLLILHHAMSGTDDHTVLWLDRYVSYQYRIQKVVRTYGNDYHTHLYRGKILR